MSMLDEALRAEPPPRHLLQFYEADDYALIANVCAYAVRGINRGEGIVLGVTAAHWRAISDFLRGTGVNVSGLVEDGVLVHLDANATLDRILVGGYPDEAKFDSVVGSVIRQALQAGKGARAFGELVNVLWGRGQYPAAIRLEQLWHRLLNKLPFALFCAYNIDLFDTSFDTGMLDALLRAHSHLLPSGSGNELMEALTTALTETQGENKARRIMLNAGDFSRRGWPSLPRTEALILWLRKNMPIEAPEILSRAKSYYRANASFQPAYRAESAT